MRSRRGTRDPQAGLVYHAVVEGEHADVPAVVDVVASDDGIPVVLHPDARQRVVADLVIFINPLKRREEVEFRPSPCIFTGARRCCVPERDL